LFWVNRFPIRDFAAALGVDGEESTPDQKRGIAMSVRRRSLLRIA